MKLIRQLLLSFSIFFSLTVVSMAQDELLNLEGNWEYRKDSMHVEFSKADNGSAYQATIVRADWSPARVGRTLYFDVVKTGPKKWAGIEVDDKGKERKVRFFVKRDGKLHTTSYLDGVKKIQWTFNQADSDS